MIRIPHERQQEIIAMHNNGKNTAEIAKTLHATYKTIYNVLDINGIQRETRPHHTTIEKTVFPLMEKGLKNIEIQRKTGFSETAISHARKKFRVMHLTENNATEKVEQPMLTCTCLSCGQELTIPSGVEKLKFCYICGKKIETQMEKFSGKLAGLLDNSKYMPEHIRVGYVDTIRELIDTLENAFKKGEIKGWQ